MRRAHHSWLSSLILAALLAIVLIPILAGFAAVFFRSERLTSGLQFLAWQDYSLSNAVDKYRTLAADGRLASAFMRSLLLATVIGLLTAWSAMIAAFILSRQKFRGATALRLAGYTAYLAPPVILVIALAWLAAAARGPISALLVLALGQCTFLFPLNYALALGHWAQTPYEIDRTAATDGAGLLARLRVHMAPGNPSLAFMGGLALLTFMLSWSDLLFSRYLLMRHPDQRLLTDLVVERLGANDVVAARGELAAVAVMTSIVAALAASAYSVMFNHVNRAK